MSRTLPGLSKKNNNNKKLAKKPVEFPFSTNF